MSQLKHIQEFAFDFCSIDSLAKFDTWWKNSPRLLERWDYASSREIGCEKCHKHLPEDDNSSCLECNARVVIQRVLTQGRPIYSEWNLAKVAGMEKAKNTAKMAIDELMKDRPRIDKIRPKYMLLFGPPGTGKTTLALALSGEYKLPLNSLDTAAIGSTYVDGRALKIHEFFESARRMRKSIILVDEAEQVGEMGGKEAGEMSKGVNTLKEELAGARGRSNNFYVICATNKPWKLDSAVLSRLGTKYYVGLPDHSHRALILQNELKKNEVSLTDVEVNDITGRLPWASGRDIEQIVSRAVARANGILTPALVLEECRQQTWSTTSSDLEEMLGWAKKNSVAESEIQQMENDLLAVRQLSKKGGTQQ